MSIAETSSAGSSLLPGSLILTRDKAMKRGCSFHEAINEMTGARAEIYQAPLSGMSVSLANAVQAQETANGLTTYRVTGTPTKVVVHREDELRAEAAEDLAGVEKAVTTAFQQAGIDTGRGISLKPHYDEATGACRIEVGRDHPQWREIEALFDGNPALTNDLLRVNGQQQILAQLRVLQQALHPAAGREGDGRGRLDPGSVHRLDNGMLFSQGRLSSAAQASADRLLG